jgi:hypothetical protein
MPQKALGLCLYQLGNKLFNSQSLPISCFLPPFLIAIVSSNCVLLKMQGQDRFISTRYLFKEITVKDKENEWKKGYDSL